MALPRLVIGDVIIPTPIIQGGMGIGVSLAGLSSAVATAGGVGVISAAGIGGEEADFKTNYVSANTRALRREIREAKSRTSGVLGVNIMVALTNYAELVRASVEEGIDIIFSGAGLPLDLPRHLDGKTSPKLAPIVSSGRAASIICRKWKSRFGRTPDAFVVEGPMAGGHLGFKPDQIADPEYRLEKLVPDVVEAAAAFGDIPVIAAGGVYTGADIRKYFDLGARGVQLGTRFVATHECDVSPAFKQAYLDAKKEDMHIIKSPVGMPGRAIRNQFIEKVEAGRRSPYSCPFHCLSGCNYTTSPFCITMALLNAKRGNLENGLIFAGENAWRVTGLTSVAELIDELVQGYDATFTE